jgi:hypothetical protein
MTLDDLPEFVEAFLECALWSSTDCDENGEGSPLDENYDTGDFDEKLLAELTKDCADFVESNLEDLSELDAGQCGHDFWLTRNGHGTGFWDRGLGELGERLSKACKPYGGVDLVAQEGKVVS